MSDFCPIKGFDHLEFYVGNAKQAALFYSKCFGFTNIAYRGLETGSRKTASYVIEQGNIRFVLSTGLNPDSAIAQSVLKHGDNVAVIALEVPDAVDAYKEAVSRGAIGAIAPTEEDDGRGLFRYSAIHAYGDVSIKFVDRGDYSGVFAPGFEPLYRDPIISIRKIPATNSIPPTPLIKGGKGGSLIPKFKGNDIKTNKAGLKAIDHVVGNVEFGGMERWAKFFAETMDFSLLVHFDEKTISTKYSSLMSKVMQDGSGKIKLPINEPAEGERKSQIQEYLEYNCGPGIQHIALATDNIIETVTQLKSAGVEFLETPKAYYDRLEQRIGTIDEPIDKLAELGILVDRDEDGYLLQIFTQPVQDRPTLFFEVIERHGAQGFGEGNFKALFEAIEREQSLRGNL